MTTEEKAKRIAYDVAHDLHEGFICGLKLPLEQISQARQHIYCIALQHLDPENADNIIGATLPI